MNQKLKNVFNFDNSNIAQNNKNNKNNAVCDKKKFTQITQKKFYRYQLQINYTVK